MEEDFAQWYTDVCKKSRTERLHQRKRMHGHQTGRICDLGEYPAKNWIADSKKQVWRMLSSNVHSREPFAERKRSCRRICTRSSMGNTWWTERIAGTSLRRPTSETLFCDFYSNDIQSHRDLPKVYNQWCSVVVGKRQQDHSFVQRVPVAGRHTAHATAEEAEERTEQMLNLYADFCEVSGNSGYQRTENRERKICRCRATYTIEA